ncbi:MAG: methylase domain protein [Verrucomicrobiales bacterium]|nr:methylase domain protein [Verrucomicrobiales bacterium]
MYVPITLPRMSGSHLEFNFASLKPSQGSEEFLKCVSAFCEFGEQTRQLVTESQTFDAKPICVATFVNEFWTTKQRAASRLHEISYRACFKPQLPRFFIERLTAPGDTVYDPFMGRGTTLVESALLGRIPFGCDINPLSAMLTRPRINPPTLDEIGLRLQEIDFADYDEWPEELFVFYHPETLKQIVALKKFLLLRAAAKTLDYVDEWIRMVAVNRLTGHSTGFFSVYTLPPNQAVSIKSQIKINADRNQTPPKRNVVGIILKKSQSLLSDCDAEARGRLNEVASRSLLLTEASSSTFQIPENSVSLVVTSPPFLDVVDYAGDNWLRCWFVGIDAKSVQLTVPKKIEDWQRAMTEVFRELHRMLKPGGYVAFEVGEVRGGKVKLEEAVLPCGIEVGLKPELILINDQEFTKTANCWGVNNNAKGTNTNRIVLFRKA